ncbi:protein kinase [Streptomyces sp. TP-A0356]|uniref:serine/threonine-protein kinase n=1 Tax=Streptomyces sp. TP-A0356 TaxID=1359208 RepID=UPI00352B06DC
MRMKQQVLIAGRYQLNTTIGRGAMGEVWRAYDQMLGRPVAVKLLLTQNADPTADSRFRLEAQTAGRLHHPHVVGVLDFGEHEGRLFLVMELVEGDSLSRVLSDDGPLPAERVAHIAAQAAAGLAVAHEQGIVHRDIKPGNLLLDAGGTVKIGDFGIARFMDDPSAALTATGQIVGTSLYIAPERALGKPAGPASDVYSLGCVLYQLLTGHPPFRADTPIAILHHHLDTPPVPPRELGVGLPPAFENYLLGLLAKRPEDRPTARQAADWFATGAWRGRPEPLPAAARRPHHATVAAPEPPVLPRPETGPPTTYKLPSAPAGPGHRAAHRQRPSTAPHRQRPSTAPHRERPSAGAQRERPPTATRGERPSAGSRRGRPSIGGFVTRRPRAVGLIAAAALFLTAMFVGMAVFSPDSSSAETPSQTQSSPAAPAP